MKERELTVDFAKAISILGVVAIHSSSEATQNFAVYFSFGVPLFIIFSFYLLDKKYCNQEICIAAFFRKRISRLLIPYLFWSFFYFFLFNFGKRTDLIRIITGYFTGFGWAGQYYLLLLIQLTFIYPFVKQIKLNFKKSILITTVIFIAFIIPFLYLGVSLIVAKMGYVPFVYALPYMFWGINISRIKLTKLKLKTSFVFLISLPFIPLLLYLERYVWNIEKIKGYPSYSNISVILVAFILSYCFLRSSDLIEKTNVKLKQIITIISTYSLGIYCLNPLAIKYTAMIVPYILSNKILVFLTTWLVSFIVSLLLSILISRLGKLKTLVM
jgi:fucose 4-O-acetylase-like acetyltransferase